MTKAAPPFSAAKKLASFSLDQFARKRTRAWSGRAATQRAIKPFCEDNIEDSQLRTPIHGKGRDKKVWFPAIFVIRRFYITYRASHVLVDLGWVDLDLRSSPGWWAAIVASNCPSRVVGHPKSKSET